MSNSPSMRKCVWYISCRGEYCGKPSRYKFVKDDDGNRVKVYSGFCKEHEKLAEEEGWIGVKIGPLGW